MRFFLCFLVLSCAMLLFSLALQLHGQTNRIIDEIEENTITVAVEQFPVISYKTYQDDGSFYMNNDTQVSDYDAWQETLASSSIKTFHYGSFCTAYSDALYPAMPGLQGRVNAHSDYQYAENTVLLRVRYESDTKDNATSHMMTMKVLEVLFANDPATVTDELFVQNFIYGENGKPLFEAGKNYVVLGRLFPNETINLGSIRTIKGNTKSRYEEIIGSAWMYISDNYSACETIEVAHPEYGLVTLRIQNEKLPLIVEENDPRVEEMKKRAQLSGRQLWVSGVDQLEYVPYFATGDAYITHGRTFTPEEYASSARVCLVSGTFAQKNQLNIGDQIDLSFFDNAAMDSNMGNARTFWQIYPLDFEAEPVGQGTYEIIGFYNGPEWQYGYYCFSPNTIFLPKTSLAQDGIEKEIQFRMDFTNSVILQNGKTQDFLSDAADAGMEGWAWRVYDNGYTSYMNGLENMKQDTQLVLMVCILAFAVLVLSALGIMARHLHQDALVMYRIGTTNKQTVGYIFGCLLPIILLSSVVAYAIHCAVHAPMNTLLENWYAQGKPAYSTASATVGMISNYAQDRPAPVGCAVALAVSIVMASIFAAVYGGGKAVKA